MKYRLLDWLACPACRCPDLALRADRVTTLDTWHGHWEPDEEGVSGLDLDERRLQEVVEGQLSCPSCSRRYPIRDGVPRMLLDEDVSPASGHRWTRFDGSEPEFEENFLDMIHPLQPTDFLGKLVVDAGCGFGRHSFFAARYGAEVVSLDRAADAVGSARANTRKLHRVHVVQGDYRNPPLRSEAFDLAMCMGVLHHAEDPRADFGTLQELLHAHGRLLVWVYGPRQGSVRHVSKALHGTAKGLDDESLYRLSSSLATTLRAVSHTPYRVMRHVPGIGRIVSHLPTHDHHKWPFDVVVADIYDRLRIPVTRYVTGEELERWFAEAGYADITVTRRVRNNESFRGTGVRR